MKLTTFDASGGANPATANVDDLAALFKLTDRLYRAASLDEVYASALDAIHEALGCDRASILLFDRAGVMRFVAWRGLSDAYRIAVDGHSPWTAGQQIADPIVVPDIKETAEPEAIKGAIRAEGICALAFIPLMVRGGVAGKFMTYHSQRRTFSKRELEMAVLIARQVGFSLERALADQEREAAEGALRRQESLARVMLENAPVMIWTSDAQGHCHHLNRMLREFWGVAENSISSFDWSTTLHPDDAASVGLTMMDALSKREGVRVRGRYRSANGDYRVLLTDAQPRFADDGAFLGFIGVNVDVTEREQHEAALRQSEERFRLVVESAPSGMVITDARGKIVLVNAKAERLFGYSRDDLVGSSVERLVPERQRGAHADFRQRLFFDAGDGVEGSGRVVQALRHDGSEFPAEVGLSVIRSPTGQLYLATVVDISERRKAEEQRTVLLAELNHRVKNTLALVQGIAQQTFKGSAADLSARRAFEGRLQALAIAHNRLTRSNWSHATLEQLVTDSVGQDLIGAGRIRMSGSAMMLDPKSALAVTMALHELLTNAVKYGSLSNDTGAVVIEWHPGIHDPNRFVLEWSEINGPPVQKPARSGFGSRLIQRILASDLEGEVSLDFHPSGVCCRIEGSRQSGAGAEA